MYGDVARIAAETAIHDCSSLFCGRFTFALVDTFMEYREVAENAGCVAVQRFENMATRHANVAFIAQRDKGGGLAAANDAYTQALRQQHDQFESAAYQAAYDAACNALQAHIKKGTEQ